MIEPDSLTDEDIGRRVVYRRDYITETGVLTSWNKTFVFVRFLGPTGEACCPEDISFENGSET